MHDLIELLVQWAEEVRKLQTKDLVQLLRLGSKVASLLELKNRLPGLGRGLRRAAGSAPQLAAETGPIDTDG